MGLVGIEVSSDEELARIGKGITIAQIKETVDRLREHNIATVGTVLIGLEDDDEAMIKERLRIAHEIDPDILALDYVTPVPGSAIWRRAVKNGWIKPKEINLREWDFHHPVVPTKYLSIEDVGRLGACGVIAGEGIAEGGGSADIDVPVGAGGVRYDILDDF